MSQSGYKSDQMAVVAALQQWQARKSQSEKRRFCSDNYLSHDRLVDIDKLTREFLQDLSSLGLVMNLKEATWHGTAGSEEELSIDNCNSDKPRIVAAATCAGLYPQVARILDPKAF